MSQYQIHDVYEHIKNVLHDPNSAHDKNLLNLLQSESMQNSEFCILFAAMDLYEKKFNDEEYLVYPLLPGGPLGLKSDNHIYQDFSIPPHTRKIKGIIFTDKVPSVVYFDHYRPFDGIYKTISYPVIAKDVSDYVSDNKTYKIWAPLGFSINSSYQDGIKFLRFDQEIDITTIGFVLQLRNQDNKYIRDYEDTNNYNAIVEKKRKNSDDGDNGPNKRQDIKIIDEE
jgi:hypothetical protein